MSDTALIGTRKGLFTLSIDDGSLTLSEPVMPLPLFWLIIICGKLLLKKSVRRQTGMAPGWPPNPVPLPKRIENC